MFGVFKNRHAGYRVPDVNFHGLTLPVRLPQIDAVEGGVWSARADIGSCPELELVLPARKEAVETPFLEEMREAARLAVYRAIAQADPAPRLAWTDWHKAREAGIKIPEPPAELRPWRPSIADTDYLDERSTFAAVGNYASGSSPEQGMVMQADPEPPEAQALHRALKRAGRQGGSEPALRLFAPEPRFDGYPWYDALPRVTAIETRVTVNGASCSLESFAILRIAMSRNGQRQSRCTCMSCIRPNRSVIASENARPLLFTPISPSPARLGRRSMTRCPW